jgi:hypothetical protein
VDVGLLKGSKGGLEQRRRRGARGWGRDKGEARPKARKERGGWSGR